MKAKDFLKKKWNTDKLSNWYDNVGLETLTELMEEYASQSQAEQSSMHISYAAQTIRTMPLDQAIQQIKAQLTGQPETAVIDGELVVSVQAEQLGVTKAIQKQSDDPYHLSCQNCGTTKAPLQMIPFRNDDNVVGLLLACDKCKDALYGQRFDRQEKFELTQPAQDSAEERYEKARVYYNTELGVTGLDGYSPEREIANMGFEIAAGLTEPPKDK